MILHKLKDFKHLPVKECNLISLEHEVKISRHHISDLSLKIHLLIYADDKDNRFSTVGTLIKKTCICTS